MLCLFRKDKFRVFITFVKIVSSAMTYLHIIFDVDGTLIDTYETYKTSLNRTAIELLGRAVTHEELSNCFGVPSNVTIDYLKFEDKAAALNMWEKYYREAAVSYSHPFKGISEMLHALAKKAHIGIVTSRNHDEINADPFLREHLSIFTAVIGADDSTTHKPQPGPLLAYLEKSGAKPDECVYFGDTQFDALCAQSAGIDFVLADMNCIADAGIQRMHTVHSVAEMADFLELNK